VGHGRHAGSHLSVGGGEVGEHPASGRGQRFGRHPVEHAQGHVQGALLGDFPFQLDRLHHRHLLGERGEDSRGAATVGDHAVDPLDLAADQTAANELQHRARRPELREDVPAGAAVDDDQVPHRTLALVATSLLEGDLAGHEHVPGSGDGGGDEVDDARQWGHPRQPRHLEVDAQVFLQRLLGMQPDHADTGLHHLGLEARPCRAKRRGEVALGVDLDAEDLLAALGGEQAERGGDGGLAGASLAGHEDDPPPEQLIEQARRCA